MKRFLNNNCIFILLLVSHFWEAGDEEKNAVSHRWRAIAALLEKEKE